MVEYFRGSVRRNLNGPLPIVRSMLRYDLAVEFNIESHGLGSRADSCCRFANVASAA